MNGMRCVCWRNVVDPGMFYTLGAATLNTFLESRSEIMNNLVIVSRIGADFFV
jgi:hypothetical protein